MIVVNKQDEKKHIEDIERLEYAEHVGKWYGWGSPIGLSVFFLAISLIVGMFIELGIQIFK